MNEDWHLITRADAISEEALRCCHADELAWQVSQLATVIKELAEYIDRMVL